jgi:hypothetical protein
MSKATKKPALRAVTESPNVVVMTVDQYNRLHAIEGKLSSLANLISATMGGNSEAEADDIYRLLEPIEWGLTELVEEIGDAEARKAIP